MILFYFRAAYARMLSGDAFRSNLLRRLANTDIDYETFDWLNDVTDLCHNEFATSASSDKAAFALRFLTLFVL